MSLAAFDTLKLARTLRDSARFPAEQAEGLAAALAEAVQDGLPSRSEVQAEFASVRADIATVRTELKTEIAAVRTDIATVRTELKTEIAAVRSELKSELKLLEHRMTIKLGGMLFALAGILIAASRYLPPVR
jgi:chromosome segregation ATPase